MEPMDSPSVPFMTPGEVFRARIVFRRDQVEAARVEAERASFACTLRTLLAVYLLGATYLILALLGVAPVPLV